MTATIAEHTTQRDTEFRPHAAAKGLSGLYPASAPDLAVVNEVVAEATLSWGLADRVRRLALPSLYYTERDLEDMTVVLLDHQQARGVALATWEDAVETDLPPGIRALLLHGLYVKPEWQGLGIGGNLLEFAENWAITCGQDAIALRAWRQSESYFVAQGYRPLDRGRAPDLYPRWLWKAV